MGKKTRKTDGKKLPNGKSLPLPTTSTELTKSQVEVLQMLNDGYTIKQIALRRKTTVRAVNYAKEKLRKKGLWLSTSQRGVKCQQIGKFSNWRIHGLRFVIKPYYFYPRYEKCRKEIGNHGIPWRQWKINLHRNNLEIYLSRAADFTDKNKRVAMRKAEESLNRTIFEAGNRFGFEVFKEGKANIRLVAQSYAVNPSDHAEESKQHIKIRGDDGKVWLEIDQSKGWEHEYPHSDDALIDSDKVEPWWNSVRKHNLLEPHDTQTALMFLARKQTESFQLMIQQTKQIDVLIKAHENTNAQIASLALSINIIAESFRAIIEPAALEKTRQDIKTKDKAPYRAMKPDYVG